MFLRLARRLMRSLLEYILFAFLLLVPSSGVLREGGWRCWSSRKAWRGFQGLLHSFNSTLPWSSSFLETWYPYIVYSVDRLVNCRMCQVLFDSLLVEMMVYWRCCYHFFDLGVSDHAIVYLLYNPSQTSHICRCCFYLRTLSKTDIADVPRRLSGLVRENLFSRSVDKGKILSKVWNAFFLNPWREAYIIWEKTIKQ